MTIEINSPKLTPSVATYGAFAIRKSDNARWNNVAGAWQASPSNSDAFIALTDRGGVNAGLYRGSNSGDMGDAGLVEITLHDSASSYALVAGTGAGTLTVMGGDEVQTALVGSAMTLAADAVNAAALATDAVAEMQSGLATAAMQQADIYVDTSTTPWDLVWMTAGTGGIGVGTELMRKSIHDVAGANLTSTATVVGQVHE